MQPKRLKDYNQGKGKKNQFGKWKEARTPNPPNIDNKRARQPVNLSQLGIPSDPKDPVDTFNEESQYARYDKGINLAPVKEEEVLVDNNNTDYRYFFDAFDKTRDQFWIVTVTEKQHYVSFLKNLTIFCGGNIQIDETIVDTNIDDIDAVWRQTQGNRTITVIPNSGETYPTLRIESRCFTPSLCDQEGDRNLAIRLYPQGEEFLFDELIIFGIPFSVNTGFEFIPSPSAFNPYDDIGNWYFIPRYTQQAFIWNDASSMEVTWYNPSFLGDSHYHGSYWLKNEDGDYESITPLLTDRVFSSFNYGEYYQVLTLYRQGLSEFGTYQSRIIRIPIPDNTLSYLFGNDTLVNSFFVNTGLNAIEQLDISSQIKEIEDISLHYLNRGINQIRHYDLSLLTKQVVDDVYTLTATVIRKRKTVSNNIRKTINHNQRRLVVPHYEYQQSNSRMSAYLVVGRTSITHVDQSGSIIG